MGSTYDSEGYSKNAGMIKTVTYDDLDCESVSVDDLSDRISTRLTRGGIQDLFPVQKAAYKLFIEGRELIVKSKTGSGKTLAFLIPLNELMLKDKQEEGADGNRRASLDSCVKAIILEPTRELAQQV